MRIGTVLGLTVTALACVRAQPATVRTVDAFERPELWRALPASGVELKVSSDRGRAGGSALRLDFDFRGRGGWAAVNRALPVSLPDNYELSFWLKGDAPKNTLELKLIDQTGENVWWVNRPEFEFAGDWRRVTFRKRQVTFAWGPARGGDLREAAAIEFAITAGTGGRGTVWIDDLTLAPRDPVRPYDLQPTITASTESNAAPRVFDADSATFWRSKMGGTQHLTIDFLRSREFGGLRIDWLRPGRARDYDVQISGNGRDWETIRAVRAGGRARDYLALPETETRWIRLHLLRGGEQDGFGIREIDVLPLEFGATRNRLFEALAHDAPRGHYPKYFLGAQSYWTVVGVPGDPKEALLDAQGVLEVDARAFSLEPFIYAHGRLLTWADGELQQSLERGDLPVPSVQREAENFALTVTAWAAGDPGNSRLWARYRIQNRSASPQRATFYVAMRPFQVNPTWQFLNNPGGASVVRVIESSGARIDIDQRQIWPVTQPSGFGAALFDQGDITEWLRRGELPEASRVADPVGHASAALAYALDLPAAGTRDVIVVTPLHAAAPGVPIGQSSKDAAELAQKSLDSTIQWWSTELDRFRLELPGDAARIARALRTNLAYILINQDHAAIQPGSRAYQRSWIRDGSLTSAALLRLGRAAEVRKFIEWYASFQYADGKVPCCVDHRGADPVPEHDSHGQLIYLIAEYYRHTNDAALVERLWPQVERAVLYMDSLRQARRTAEYRAPARRAFFGLLPESISHEGYSEKPMHSYWDQFFALKGFKDAAELAGALGKEAVRARFATIREEYQADLQASIRLAMQNHNIDYLPGAVELGDFDPTSTTVAVTPAAAQNVLPEGALQRTFERYWQESEARRTGARSWTAFTPYELRTVGTFARLGDRARALAMLDWFFQQQRPPAWNHWAEVVHRDADAPRFIGDMPHTWVGSDFIRSLTDLLAYEREADDALVIAAGVSPTWVTGSGLRVQGLSTHYGTLGYTMRQQGDSVLVTFEDGLRIGRGGLVIRSPLERPLHSATVDGRFSEASGEWLALPRIPRTVVLRYAR